jgi:hypothetical protein
MPKSFDKIVEEEIDVRLDEIDKLRLHLDSVTDRDVRGYLASLLIVRLYAFLESGVKDIINLYIRAHGSKIASVAELQPRYIVWRYSKDILGHVSTFSHDTKLLKLDSEVLLLLKGNVTPREISERVEYSTMNAEALQTIYIGCDLDTALIDAHVAEINQLCHRRHDVAHGRFLSATSTQALVSKADSFKGLVTELLYDLGIQCIDRFSRLALKV